MTEHEKLKWICDEIGYDTTEIELDVREIIFTQEFKYKLSDYLAKSPINIRRKLREGKSIYHGNFIDYTSLRLGEHLDDPTTYLYNLLTK